MQNEELKVLFINESDAKSIFSDIVTLGLITAAFWANYEYIGNSFVLQVVLGIVFFIVSAGRGSAKVKHMKVADAYEYLRARLGK